jgi:GT2 family glycosyltransferase
VCGAAQHDLPCIVIPLLRQRDDWLRQCVTSALKQTVRAEVLVVCSPKTPAANLETLQTLEREFGSLRVMVQTRGGFPAAVNQGFRSAGGRRVGLLQSDDWLMPDTVETCMAYDTDIVTTGYTCFAANGKDVYELLSSNPDRAAWEALPTLEEKAFVLSHFFLFRASKIREVGGLDESIGDSPGIDDYDFIWTLLEHGATVSIVAERMYCYRDHEEIRLTLGDREMQLRNLNRILDKHGVTGEHREKAVLRHGVWYGRPMHQVPLAELSENVDRA